MAERDLESMVSLLCDRTIGDAPSVFLRVALDAEIPAGVKRYLQTEVVHWFETDLDRSPHLGQINLQAPGTAHLRNTLLRSLAAAYELPREQYLELLREASAFTQSYLVRPQWTLERFLFEGREEITLAQLRTGLDRCADYAYFGRLLERVFQRRGSTSMTAAEFRSVITIIDDQVVRQHGPRELAALARPIFDFFLLKEAGPDDPIPLKPLLAFLDDKKMTFVREYVESICRLRNASVISMNELGALIEALESEQSVDRPGQADADGGAGHEDAAAEPITEEPVTTSPEEGKRESPAPAPPLGPPAALSKPVIVPPEDVETEEMEMLPDLRSALTEKQRQRFIRNVFNRDQAYFYGVLATLNSMHSWKDASAYLQQVYKINNVDPFKDDTVEFTDLVHRRFTSGSKGQK